MTFSTDWVLNIKESVKMCWPQLVSEPIKSTPLLVQSIRVLFIAMWLTSEDAGYDWVGGDVIECIVYMLLKPLKSSQILWLNWSMVPEATEKTTGIPVLGVLLAWGSSKKQQLWNKVGSASNMEKDDNTITHACMLACMHAHMHTHACMHARTHAHTLMHTHTGIIQMLKNYAKQAKFLACHCVHYHCTLNCLSIAKSNRSGLKMWKFCVNCPINKSILLNLLIMTVQ